MLGVGEGTFPTGQWGSPAESGLSALAGFPASQAAPHFPSAICGMNTAGALRFTGLHVFSALPVHKFMIALLGAKHQDICFSACGVLLNLTVDRDRRLILKEGGGIKK